MCPLNRREVAKGLASLAGLAILDLDHQVSAQTPVVRIACGRNLAAAPLWNMSKHAAQFGLQTDVSVLFTYAEQLQATRNNQVQTATSGITNPAIIADQSISNVRVIAGQLFGGANFVLRKGVTAASWKDLAGKRIGLVPGTYTQLIFLVAAQEGGAELDKINIVNISVGATVLEAIRKGDLDGFVLFAPTVEQAVLEGIAYYPRHLDIGASSLGPANGIIVASTEFLANKALTANFLKAYVASLHELRNRDAFVKVATQLAGITEAVANEGFKNLFFGETIDVQAIVGAAKLGQKFGFAKSDVSNKVAQLIDFGPLMEATGKTQGQLTGVPSDAIKHLRS